MQSNLFWFITTRGLRTLLKLIAAFRIHTSNVSEPRNDTMMRLRRLSTEIPQTSSFVSSSVSSAIVIQPFSQFDCFVFQMISTETQLSSLNSLTIDLVHFKSLIACMLLRSKTTRTVPSIGFKGLKTVSLFRDPRISLKFLCMICSQISKASVSICVHSYVEHVSSILIKICCWLRDAIIWYVTFFLQDRLMFHHLQNMLFPQYLTSHTTFLHYCHNSQSRYHQLGEEVRGSTTRFMVVYERKRRG